MAKKRVAVQMSLTIPPELRREMDEVGDGVNWSQVAAEAFRAKVLTIRASTKGTSMEDVIARIKAADAMEANESYQLGKEIGTAWASEGHPTKVYLRLEELQDTQKADADGIGIYFAISGAHSTNWRGAAQEAYEFWEQFPWHYYSGWSDDQDVSHLVAEMSNCDAGRPAIGQSALVRGFIEGALEVWDTVKGKL